jgi:hypothetical protein
MIFGVLLEEIIYNSLVFEFMCMNLELIKMTYGIISTYVSNLNNNVGILIQE